jgi:hypothetical protein
VFYKDAPGDENVIVRWLSDVDFASIQEIPSATVDYYNTSVGAGEIPFNYQCIPHIIYKGNVAITSADVISIGK